MLPSGRKVGGGGGAKRGPDSPRTLERCELPRVGVLHPHDLGRRQPLLLHARRLLGLELLLQPPHRALQLLVGAAQLPQLLLRAEACFLRLRRRLRLRPSSSTHHRWRGTSRVHGATARGRRGADGTSLDMMLLSDRWGAITHRCGSGLAHLHLALASLALCELRALSSPLRLLARA
jgi:hypothetical protein